MARKLTLGVKPPQSGNKVSHSHRKTKRKWESNIQKKSLYSMALARSIRLTIPTCIMRSVDKAGGLDSYLLQTPEGDLTGTMRRLQEQIRSRQEAA
ncbi:MAG: 50S ribosomal protein L28 [Magnetococcales bacterium]|nr:50S ribosomal protein L28 [Magnetococcales bacterium]